MVHAFINEMHSLKWLRTTKTYNSQFYIFRSVSVVKLFEFLGYYVIKSSCLYFHFAQLKTLIGFDSEIITDNRFNALHHLKILGAAVLQS